MKARKRLVIDTNALVSYLLLPRSFVGKAIQKALEHDLLFSEATMNELADVLARPKFDAYISMEDRQQFLRLLLRIVVVVPVVSRVLVCRDPHHDDKVLEVAINGNADLILTGDKDLLSLREFKGIAIMSPASYLDRLSTER